MGYFGDRSRWYESLLLLGGSFCLLKPGLVTDMIGFVLVGSLYLYQRRRRANAAIIGPAGQ